MSEPGGRTGQERRGAPALPSDPLAPDPWGAPSGASLAWEPAETDGPRNAFASDDGHTRDGRTGDAQTGGGHAHGGAGTLAPVRKTPSVSPVDQAREASLVESAKLGDAGAIEALYRTYHATIYRYVLFRVGSATAAEDVTSQVFLGMVRQLPRFRWQGKPFVSWLYAIAQKQVAMHHRSVGRAGQPVDLDAAEDLIADTAGPHADAEERERRVKLAGGLRMLPDTQREVLLLRFVLSFSLAETAASVGKSEGAVKQLQVRGLGTLRDILGGSGL